MHEENRRGVYCCIQERTVWAVYRTICVHLPEAHGAPLRLPAPAAVRPVDPAVRAPGPVGGVRRVDHGAAGVEAGLEVAVAAVGRAAVHAAREERPHEGPPEIRIYSVRIDKNTF